MSRPHVWSALALAGMTLLLLTVLSGCGGSSSSSSSSVSSTPVDQQTTLSNLKKLSIALTEYTQDYDEQFPRAQSTQALMPVLMPYARDSSIFVDPNTNTPFTWNVSLVGTTQVSYPDYSKIVTFYDATPPVAGARPVALLNDTALLTTDAQWQQLKTSSNIP